MPKPVVLTNGRSWPTQGQAQEYFKSMLARYSDNAVIEDSTDHDDLVALLERYDDVIVDGPPKIGVGIEHFMRRRNAGIGYSTPGFWVRRTDGTETDFSYIAAVKGTPKPQSLQFHDACRAAVALELVDAKKRHFARHGDTNGCVTCDVSDELISYDEAHLDHAYPTFGQLVVTFRAARGWQHAIPDGTLSRPADGQTTTTFTKPEIADAFREFHKSAAMIRVISAKRNMSMASRQRRPRIKRQVEI